jgi:hypothetical protein
MNNTLSLVYEIPGKERRREEREDCRNDDVIFTLIEFWQKHHKDKK